MENSYNKELIAAVEYLKGKRIITKDADIVRDTGVHKTQLSTYLSGQKDASKGFLKKFQDFYKVDIFANKVEKEYVSKEDFDLLVTRCLRLESRVNVYGVTILELVAGVSGKLGAVVSSELQKATDMEFERLSGEGKPK